MNTKATKKKTKTAIYWKNKNKKRAVVGWNEEKWQRGMLVPILTLFWFFFLFVNWERT